MVYKFAPILSLILLTGCSTLTPKSSLPSPPSGDSNSFMQTFIGAATVATSTNFLAIGLTVFGIVKAIGAFNLTLNPEIVKWAERIAYVAIAIGGIRAGGWL